VTDVSDHRNAYTRGAGFLNGDFCGSDHGQITEGAIPVDDTDRRCFLHDLDLGTWIVGALLESSRISMGTTSSVAAYATQIGVDEESCDCVGVLCVDTGFFEALADKSQEPFFLWMNSCRFMTLLDRCEAAVPTAEWIAAVLEPSIHPAQCGLLGNVRNKVAVTEGEKCMGGFVLEQAIEVVNLQVHEGAMFLRQWISVIQGESIQQWPRRDQGQHLVEVALNCFASEKLFSQLREVDVPIIA
jgi:hypothetical protein